ncbi:UvrD-helicase domain-containing protein [Salinisphaera sp. SWV1]|uniref:UvrD-helicase domain-containing protein n=1 Tax=Salinisphaera sp. SWV1 TaxID=3454139 RepID=UPI003F8339A9
MWNFIYFDDYAASQIVENRFFQSTEYELGKAFALYLTQCSDTTPLIKKTEIVEHNGGLYFLKAEGPAENTGIVFDLNQCALQNNRKISDFLLIVQKLLRFSIKYWRKLNLSSSETIISSTNKAVIFPYPITTQSSFRITVDRAPDAKRLAKRGGNFLLVYSAGYDDKGAAAADPALNIFRKAIDSLPKAKDIAKNRQTNDALQEHSSTALQVFELGKQDRPTIHNSFGFENWLRILTGDQKEFVKTESNGPERIEGPAGTGKTLCMALKAINNLQSAKKNNKEFHVLFVAHSSATKNNIKEVFENNGGAEFLGLSRNDAPVTLQIETLQEWCIDHLRDDLSETEYLDRDAADAKELQVLYILEAIDEVIEKSLSSYRPMLSERFLRFIDSESRWALAELVQHEIAVEIKGRSGESLSAYQELRRVKYGIPVEIEADFAFIFEIFKSYQKRLISIGQFDSDDIILTAIGQLDTPIWRRRRSREGYSSIYLDEIHLFNLNELSLFHLLTDAETNLNFVYSRDTSQATGDRGGSVELAKDGLKEASISIRNIFRCAPAIVELAFYITTAGASLFTNFENPLDHAMSLMTNDEESKAIVPSYASCTDDDAMLKKAFDHASTMCKSMECSKSEVLLVATTNKLLAEIKSFADKSNKPIELIKTRGDIEVVQRAKQSGRFVVGGLDYVGGLEFSGVIVVGADDGRLPPTDEALTEEGKHFIRYAAHNRLYVAVTRAKYQVQMIGTSGRGPSPLLAKAFQMKAIVKE